MTSSRDFRHRLKDVGLLIADGAMGTALQQAGLPPGGCPELWNIERPGVVRQIASDYVRAGAEMLFTNSFGGSPPKLAAYGLEHRCEELNRRAATIAREAAGDAVMVIGSVGPTGALLEPLGPLNRPDAADAFRRQVAALAEGGADGLCIETMIDIEEAEVAVRAAKETGLPVLASMTFDATPRGPFTIMGVDVPTAARRLDAAGTDGVGANCGTGPESIVPIIQALRRETSGPLLARPNAGLPVLTDNRVHYPMDANEFARFLKSLVGAGVNIVGGCCGTTPAHIRAIGNEVRRLRGSSQIPPP